jgi:membrane glycosyltransferase
MAQLNRRRLIFGFMVVATIGLLAVWFAAVLFGVVSTPLAILLFAAFLIYIPGQVIWLWDSVFGFALLNCTGDTLAHLLPALNGARTHDPIVALTAIVMTVRNGDPAPSLARLKTMQSTLEATGCGDRFHYFVLSDSTLDAAIAAEERAFAGRRTESPGSGRIFYRRRAANVDFKSGNLQDFCACWGKDYEFMIVLDADSLMTAACVMRVTRIMQANPRLGILQTLTVGLPSKGLFPRIVQFGHSHIRRCFVLGGAWWHGDCCRPRGHNCAIRIAPFAEHCRMPEFLGGEAVPKCEDGVEAALMYRAGYEVMFLAEEGGSYEGHPPTLVEFLRRQSRWCLGDLQNLRILRLAGIAAMTRFHLLFVAQKYLSAAALVAFVLLATTAAATWPAGRAFPAQSALALYAAVFAMYLAPRLIGIADAALRARHAYGGLAWLLAGSGAEIVLACLLMPCSMVSDTMTLLAQVRGRKMHWEEDRRDTYQITWAAGCHYLWPQTAFALMLLIWLAAENPASIPWFLPYLSGLILAVPVAVFTSSTRLGAWAARRHFCALPDEINSPAEIISVLPRLVGVGRAGNNQA